MRTEVQAPPAPLPARPSPIPLRGSQDLVFRKVNESDATKFAKKAKICPAQVWGFFWFLIALAFMAGAILGGLAAF